MSLWADICLFPSVWALKVTALQHSGFKSVNCSKKQVSAPSTDFVFLFSVLALSGRNPAVWTVFELQRLFFFFFWGDPSWCTFYSCFTVWSELHYHYVVVQLELGAFMLFMDAPAAASSKTLRAAASGCWQEENQSTNWWMLWKMVAVESLWEKNTLENLHFLSWGSNSV